MRPRPLHLALLATTSLIIALIPVGARGAGSASPPTTTIGTVTVVFNAGGTFHTDGRQDLGDGSVRSGLGDAQLQLHSTFAADLLNTGGVLSIRPTTTGTFDSDNAGVADDTETFVSDNQTYTSHCNVLLPVDRDATAPRLTASRTAEEVSLKAESLTSASFDVDDYDCPMWGPSDLFKMNPNLDLAGPLNLTPARDSLAANLTFPADVLKTDGSHIYPVSSDDNPPIDPSCTGAHAYPQCTQSLFWGGTVTVDVKRNDCKDSKITSVTGKNGAPLSAGQRDAMGLGGDGFFPGQQIDVPAGQTVTIHLSDDAGHDNGGIALSGGSQISVPDNCFGTGQPPGTTVTVTIKRGLLWLRHAFAGNKAKFEASPPRAVLGVRGSSYTLGRDPKTGGWLMHVIEGDGYAGLPGHRLIDVPAGRGVVITSKGPRLANTWPAADRSLVPRTYRPARITHLVVKGAAHGSPHARLRFRTDRPTTVLIKILRGHKVIAHKRVHAHTGTTAFRPYRKHLGKGHYQVTLTATTPQRAVCLASKKFTVR